MDRIFGTAIWGRDDDTLEGFVADQMQRRGTTLATMESCTGGLLASVLTDVPGTSAYFLGGLVTYGTQQKIDAGVPAEVIEEFGVVSAETAKAMARSVRERFGATYGIGVTGVLGPDPQDGVSPGTVHVAVSDASGEHALSMTMNSGRAAVKRRAVTTSLLLLRRALLGQLA